MGFLGNLFDDPTQPLQDFSPVGVNAGGLSAKMKGSQFKVTASPERLGYVSNIANLFDQQGDELSGLRASVAPGISALRASRLAEIENARHTGIGNLRDNLSRRRVLGSSFGADALSRAEAEFGQQKERVTAESFLQELSLTDKLLAEELGAKREAFNTHLGELNLETNLAAGLAGKATEQLAQNARTLATLNTEAQKAAGEFFGSFLQPSADAGAAKMASFLFPA